VSDIQNQTPDPEIEPQLNKSDGLEYRRVPSANGIKWLSQAYYLFKMSPKSWIASMIVMMLIMSIASLIQIVAPLVQILLPVFIAGLMFGCQKLKDNQQFLLVHLFQGFNQKFNQLAFIGIIYLMCALISYFLAEFITSSLGFSLPAVTPEMLESGSISIEMMQSYTITLLLISLIMMALMLPVFMAFWFAPALIILRHCDAINALRKSFDACVLNMKTFLVYGIASFLFMFLAGIVLVVLWTIFKALGLLLVIFISLAFLCIFYASMFTSFDDIFAVVTQDESEENDSNRNSNENSPDTLIV